MSNNHVPFSKKKPRVPIPTPTAKCPNDFERQWCCLHCDLNQLPHLDGSNSFLKDRIESVSLEKDDWVEGDFRERRMAVADYR